MTGAPAATPSFKPVQSPVDRPVRLKMRKSSLSMDTSTTNKPSESATGAGVIPKVAVKTGDPGVLGLACFCLPGILLQLHNLQLVGLAPVVTMGFVFGGVAQMIAGILEMWTGNNFAFCVFGTFGAFWMSLSLMLLMKHTGFMEVSKQDIGVFLSVYTCFSAGLWVLSFRMSKCFAILYTSLMVAFILADIAHLCDQPQLELPAALWFLMVCFGGLYALFHRLALDVFGRDVLPLGAPLWKG